MDQNTPNTKLWIVVLIFLIVIGLLVASSSDSGSEYEYNKNDKYYSSADKDKNGKLNGNEFQDAVGRWMDEHGY